MRVPVFVLDRHIHLSKLDAEKLFGKGYVFEKEKNFTQPGEFFVKEKIKIDGPKGEIGDISIILPFRRYSKVEIFESDNKVLGINAKPSGNLGNAEPITIIGPKGSIYLPHAAIILQPHIHMSVAQSQDFGFRNNQAVKVQTHGNDKNVIENVKIRANDKYEFDFHINSEEGKKYGLETNDWAEILD